MKPIIHVPNNVLITPTKAVGVIDKKIKNIIAQMREALLAADNPKGVGLAATQIGYDVRIFLMRPNETDPITVYINPKIVNKSTKTVKGIPGSDSRLEGCLSIPNVWGMVVRHVSVQLEYLDEKGIKHNAKFTGFESIIVQHEVDHLEGMLFTRRVLEQKGPLYKPTTNAKGEEVLEEIEI